MINIEGHEFTSTSTSRGGIVTHHAGCSCGEGYEWYEREALHRAHVLAEIAKKPLLDLQERMRNATTTLEKIKGPRDDVFQRPDVIRLAGKIEGMKVALSYVEEALRCRST